MKSSSFPSRDVGGRLGGRHEQVRMARMMVMIMMIWRLNWQQDIPGTRIVEIFNTDPVQSNVL